MNVPSSTRAARGQTLVILAFAMVGLVGMVGVVVDVGLQWADNRNAQNGADATAHAGTVVLMQYLTEGEPDADDSDVAAAVDLMAAQAGIDVVLAEYTDYLGERTIGVEVGSGGAIPTGAQGVYVVGTRSHETFLARIVGVTELTVHTDATAVTGPVPDPCAEAACPLLPLTVPNTQVTCDGQNKGVVTNDDWATHEDIVVPLCGNEAGSVGWIDWTPPAGGADELAAEICIPDTSIDLPDWFYVNATGNTNSEQVQSCLEEWLNKPILIPLFDDQCRINPTEGNPCPEGQDPVGQNAWYHFPSYASFYLTGVYIKGNWPAECDTGNGATSCLHGSFEDTSLVGTAGEYVPPDPDDPEPISQFFTVQLVK
jgi:hypothetical protein